MNDDYLTRRLQAICKLLKFDFGSLWWVRENVKRCVDLLLKSSAVNGRMRHLKSDCAAGGILVE